MTCPRCHGFCYELLISDKWATFVQTVCINCGHRAQEITKDMVPRRSAGTGMLFHPPVMIS
jgi:Zn ribbon nucleic-acid-binding protein